MEFDSKSRGEDLPRVAISVKGRFHAFALAREMQRQNALHRLITSYPKFMTRRYGIHDDYVTSLFSHELAYRAWHSFPKLIRKNIDSQFFFHERFDIAASRVVPIDSDVFVGWSSLSLHSMRRAKRLGAVTILDRGSCHIVLQRELLEEEYGRVGGKPQLPPLEIVRKELTEYEEADFICVPSTFVYRSFVDRGIKEDKLLKVEYGVDETIFHPSPRTDSVFRVIYCGVLSTQKGVGYLIQSFAELNLPNAELWLVGSLTNEIAPILKKFERGSIKHLGPFREFDLPAIYSQGSVFCLPSIQDGFGMVILQAMACGLPAICTSNTGGPDVVVDGQSGFIVPPRDVTQLKVTLEYLFNNQDLCREMGLVARQSVLENYTWDHYGRRAMSAYRYAYASVQRTRGIDTR